MHLLENVAPEVYRAYFPRSVSDNDSVSLSAIDAGCDHNYKKWPPPYNSEFFPPHPHICAEDPDWDRDGNAPPRLAARCIQTLARFFSLKPKLGCALTGGDRAKFINLLSTKEPILLTAEKIPDELYWQRCCKDLLSNADASRHGGSHKRLFLERHLQKSIERFVPQQTDLFDIKDLLNVMEPFIKRLEISELLPPTLLLYPGREDDNLEDDADLDLSQATNSLQENTLMTGTAEGSSIGILGPSLPAEINMKTPSNHFDFGTIFPQLSNLEEFYVSYRVKNCGTEFRWNMFGMTAKDADNLGAGLKICKRLRILRIHNSKMDDDKFYALYDGIKNLTNLENLQLQNNLLTDESSESLVKLISGPSCIKHLDLTNNRMSDNGAKLLATFLNSPQSKGKLEVLNLSLNSLKDKGAIALADAIGNNGTLHTLDISSNFLTHECGEALKNMIIKSPGLKQLNVACNPLKADGGHCLLHGVRNSGRLMRIDVRLTDCGRDVDLAIQQAIKNNRFAKRGPTLSSSSRSSSPSQTSGPSRKFAYPK